MDWIQVVTIIGSNIALILIMFSSTLAMYLHIDKKIDSNRIEAAEILRAIKDEMIDFHKRLCDIEARRNK